MVIAHQGGWDELAFVLLPLLIIATLLAIANRRANKIAAARNQRIVEKDTDSDGHDGDN